MQRKNIFCVKRIALVLLSLCMMFGLCACREQKHSDTFYALDTYCTFTVYGEEEALQTAKELVGELEALFSITRAESDVSRINAGEIFSYDERTKEVLSLALQAAEWSEGAFDVSISPLVEAYGFYSDDYRVPSGEQLQELLPLVGGLSLNEDGRLNLAEGQAIDLGGIAKGFIADACADALRNAGVESAILSLGGNVIAVGKKPDGKAFRVAVQDPEDENEYLGYVQLSDASLVTAGAYQRGFTQDGTYYHHILSPETGRPAESGLKSVSVLCKSSASADALSTACFVMGEVRALELWSARGDFELLLVREDSTVVATEGLRGLFEIADGAVEWVQKNP